jgi:hypothetical protein
VPNPKKYIKVLGAVTCAELPGSKNFMQKIEIGDWSFQMEKIVPTNKS